MREIVLDTETTGLNPLTGDRVIEIGLVELNHHLPTGRTFHRYFNPERNGSSGATEVHGLTDTFLAGQQLFAECVDELLEFIGDARLVIHNAAFDIGFLNAELSRLGLPPLPLSRALDTVEMARGRWPGAQVSLDALCKRFDIDLSCRALHGALKDAELLAQVYLELVGGRQRTLVLAPIDGAAAPIIVLDRPIRPPRPHGPSPEELAAHLAFLSRLESPLWLAQ